MAKARIGVRKKAGGTRSSGTRVKSRKIYPLKSSEMPATQSMLYEVRGELKSDITSVQLSVKSLEKKMDARFIEVDARFKEVDARFDKVDARFEEVNSKLESMLAAMHKSNALVEEQNARNRYVLDGYAQLFDSNKSLEGRVENLEKKAW